MYIYAQIHAQILSLLFLPFFSFLSFHSSLLFDCFCPSFRLSLDSMPAAIIMYGNGIAFG